MSLFIKTIFFLLLFNSIKTIHIKSFIHKQNNYLQEYFKNIFKNFNNSDEIKYFLLTTVC